MIQFEHVAKRYENTGHDVLTDFSEWVQRGEMILLTGKSGAGKSTLIRMLLKDIEPTSGTIRVFGKELGGLTEQELPYYRRKMGVVFQDGILVPERTVYENVELARIAVGAKRRDNRKVIASLFQLLGITDLFRRYPHQLSGGERQKVCLARALVNYPSLLLADEPTGNLSAEESRQIMRLFALANRQGITVVVATHDLESTEGLSCRTIML